jgi:lipopolysaccharide export system protein LptA
MRVAAALSLMILAIFAANAGHAVSTSAEQPIAIEASSAL